MSTVFSILVLHLLLSLPSALSFDSFVNVVEDVNQNVVENHSGVSETLKKSFSEYQVFKVKHKPEERQKIFGDLNGRK
jgi:hypothetical protein